MRAARASTRAALTDRPRHTLLAVHTLFAVHTLTCKRGSIALSALPTPAAQTLWSRGTLRRRARPSGWRRGWRACA
eukprot:366022-Chlamydomonas_euryale.AAC.7